MNILFLTMSNMRDISTHGIYADLMRKFQDEGRHVSIMSPRERRTGIKTNLQTIDGVDILGVRTLNLQKTNAIEKGIGQVLVESQFKKAFRKYFKGRKFDLILYSTPPITFPKVIQYAKKLNPKAMTYLLLKDIFPQNAVDLGMMVDKLNVNADDNANRGVLKFPVRLVKFLLYRKFRKKEKTLYALSDSIGCMSPANVRYVIEHNPEVDPSKVEVAPNSYAVVDDNVNDNDNLNVNDNDNKIREKYGLPVDKPIFIYGGNMGKPQGIPFLIECLKANKDREDCHFVIVGDGTEYPKLNAWVQATQPKAVSLFRKLPKEDYDALANACDVGLIFLDYRFTIPNYPSRLLPYLMSRKPIIAATDPNCDTGTIAEQNGYGFYCPSNSVEAFTATVDKMLQSDIKAMGEKGYQFFLNNYTVEHTYKAIVHHFNDNHNVNVKYDGREE